MRSTTFAFALLLLATISFADQQAWVSRGDADRAAVLLPAGSTMRAFCAPCGDETWTEIGVVQVDVSHTGSGGFWEVQVNGEGVDLAYTYVEHDRQWQNLALLLGLEASDVPRFLDGSPGADPREELTAAEVGLEHLEDALKGSAGRSARQLARARKAWERYVDAQVEAEVAVTGSPEAGVAARLRLTRIRIDEVTALLTLDP
jgi:hypothetical protein